MILLALAKTDRIRGHSSINTKRTAIIIHSLPTDNYLLPRGETLFHLPPINILEIFKDFSPATRKYSKTFHQQPENIQRLFRLQNCLSHKSPISRKYSKTLRPAAKPINSSNQQQQPAAATSSSNQQQQPAAATSKSNQQQLSAAATSKSNQQQQSTAATSSSNQPKQSTAAISSSNQQKQPTAAINSSNQQQQPAIATSSSNQQQQPATAISMHPTSITYTTNADLR